MKPEHSSSWTEDRFYVLETLKKIDVRTERLENGLSNLKLKVYTGAAVLSTFAGLLGHKIGVVAQLVGRVF